MLGCLRLGGGTTMADNPRVVGDGDLEWSEHSHGEKFGSRRKQLGLSAGGEKLGCSLYEVPPGRRAWPYHYHLANEEAIYVLEGSGTLCIGGEEIGVSNGDYVALPARAQAAHQIVNDSGGGAEVPLLLHDGRTGRNGLPRLREGRHLWRGCARRLQGEENLQQVPPRGS